MKQTINLFDALPKKESVPFSFEHMQIGWVFFLLLMVGVYFFLVMQNNSLNLDLKKVENDRHKISERIAAIQKEKGEGQKLVRGIVEDVEGKRQLLEAIQKSYSTNMAGFSAYLEALAENTVHGAWLTEISFSAGGRYIKLKGKATNTEAVLTLLDKLNQSPRFSNTPLGLLSITGEDGEEVKTIASQKKKPVDTKQTYLFELGSQTNRKEMKI